MNKTGIILFAVSSAIALPFAAQAQQSFVRELADMASAAADAAREQKEQAAAPEAVKAIFAKAEDAAEDGAINFCGFYLGMSEADAGTLVAYYGLKDGQWGVAIVPSTKEVFHLSFTIQSVRRITKGGNSFKELSQAVANRIGTMKPKFNDNYDIVGYEYKNIDGQTGFISEKDGLSLLDPTLANKSAEEKAEAERKSEAEKAEVVRKEIEEAAKVALTKLASDMVPIPGKDYAMCKYEVTQALWLAVMGKNPARFKGADRPVENVSWNDCQTFLVKLNALPEVKASGRTYRLPTADEWEFACRAGATGNYCKLEDGTEITAATLDEVAWYGEVVWYMLQYGLDGLDRGDTHSVGKKEPNAFGLYDMHGNVWEWTSSVDGGARVCCGGSLMDHADKCEAGYRNKKNPDNRDKGLGFRLAADDLEAIAKAEKAKEEEVRRLIAESNARVTAVEPVLHKMGIETVVVELPGEVQLLVNKLPNGEWFGAFEVTQVQWMSVMAKNPSKFKGGDRPVESVSWNDCQDFIKKVNELDEVKKLGFVFRLPTDDQWEYACLAGSKGDFCLGADGKRIKKSTLGEVAWYGDNSGGKTHPVGQKKPNAFGLYDIHGNVWEWTSTQYGTSTQYYSAGHIICGGGWSDRDNARGSCFFIPLTSSDPPCAAKNRLYSRSFLSEIGFRLVAGK